MRLIKKLAAMQALARQAKQKGETIALVPTMGYLHEGHLSLVAAAKEKAEVVVVSVFVNPIQFGPKEDFTRYPRDLAHDIKLLKKSKVDVLFVPAAQEMYRRDHKTYVEVAGLSQGLCGNSRPGHFRGVTTVVAKLFNLVLPDLAIFGEKDFQQQLIIKKMTKDLNFPVKIISLPTVRAMDGLALSSRNKYLNPAEREQAVYLYRALKLAAEEIRQGEKSPQKILRQMKSLIAAKTKARLDYLVMVDPETLAEKRKITGQVLIAVAADFGRTRLIDNITI